MIKSLLASKGGTCPRGERRQSGKAGIQGAAPAAALRSVPAGEIPPVGLGEGSQVWVVVELRLELPPRVFTFGGDVLGRPVALVRPVASQDVARYRRLVHFVDAVGDAHGRRRRVHRLDRSEVGGAQGAEDVQRVVR